MSNPNRRSSIDIPPSSLKLAERYAAEIESTVEAPVPSSWASGDSKRSAGRAFGRETQTKGAILLSFVFAILLSLFVNSLRLQIIALQNQLNDQDQLNDQVNTNHANDTTTYTTLFGLRLQMSALETKLDKLNDQAKTFNATETALFMMKDQISAVEAQVIDVTNAGTLLNNQVTTLQDQFSAVEAIANLGVVPIGSIIAFGGVVHAVSIASLADAGYALCNGQTPAQQGIENAVLNGVTPDLDDGQYLKGVTAISSGYGSHLSAVSLIFSSAKGSVSEYTHGAVKVPTDGSVATDSSGRGIFSGEWASPGTKLGVRWERGDPEPKNYGVLYIIRVR